MQIKKTKEGYYVTQDGKTIKLPRVTSILSFCQNFTQSKFYLDWVDRMGGKSKASKYTNQCATLGTRIHSAIEALNQKDVTKFAQKIEKVRQTTVTDFSKNKLAIDGNKALSILENQKKLFVHPSIDVDVLTTKQKRIVYQKNNIAFAGELDELINIKEENVVVLPKTGESILGRVIVDLKNSTKQKKVEWTLGYQLQLAAYSLGWEECTGESIDQSIVAIGTPKSVVYYYNDKFRMDFYKDWFKKCVSAYMSKEPFDWESFEAFCGILRDPEQGYTYPAKLNMLPKKVKLYET